MALLWFLLLGAVVVTGALVMQKKRQERELLAAPSFQRRLPKQELPSDPQQRREFLKGLLRSSCRPLLESDWELLPDTKIRVPLKNLAALWLLLLEHSEEASWPELLREELEADEALRGFWLGALPSDGDEAFEARGDDFAEPLQKARDFWRKWQAEQLPPRQKLFFWPLSVQHHMALSAHLPAYLMQMLATLWARALTEFMYLDQMADRDMTPHTRAIQSMVIGLGLLGERGHLSVLRALRGSSVLAASGLYALEEKLLADIENATVRLSQMEDVAQDRDQIREAMQRTRQRILALGGLPHGQLALVDSAAPEDGALSVATHEGGGLSMSDEQK